MMNDNAKNCKHFRLALALIFVLLACGWVANPVPVGLAGGYDPLEKEIRPTNPFLEVAPLSPQGLDLPGDFMPNPIIRQMIDQVSQTQVISYTGELSGAWPAIIAGEPYTITSRNTFATESKLRYATQYVYEHFAAAGLTTSYHVWDNAAPPNVIGEIQGEANPGKIVLLTAHLDNMPSGAVAPGADDNASGIAGVLTAASILGQYEWNCTLRFVAFTGEEQGLRGSSAYATKVYSDTENIAGVLNLDMVGFNALDEPVIELHTKRSIDNNQSDLAIAYLFSNVVASYNLDLTSEIIQDRESRSDHASFWSRGYPGILAIEDFSDFTPYYHSVNDTVYTLDAAYFTEFVKAAVGTFAHMGCLVVPEIAVAPSAISVSILPETSITQTLSITNYSGELTWQLAETPPVSWLSEAITAGQLAIEGIDIPLFFDTAGLPEGVYTTTLTIDSNDPDEPQTSVGVTLTTTLQPPPPPILQYLPWLTKYRSE